MPPPDFHIPKNKRRPNVQARRRLVERDIPVIEQLRKDGVSRDKIAKRMGFHPTTLSRFAKQNGIVFGHGGSRPGPLHQDWKGGRVVDKSGYILIYSPDHPNAAGARGGKYVREHRLGDS